MPVASKLTAELIEAVAKDIEAGVSVQNAAAKAGATRQAVKLWRERGEKFPAWESDPDSAPESERLYVQLAFEVQEARRKCMRALELKCHEDVMRGRVPTGLGILERLDRETWGKTEKVDHTHGLQINVQLPEWAQPKALPQGSSNDWPVIDHDDVPES